MNYLRYSKNGVALTEQFEGLRLVAYQDSTGVWTIGYGHTHAVCRGTVCTRESAEQWLWEDIATAEAAVNRDVHVQVSQSEFDALVDFAFNCGVRNLESSTLLKLVNAGDFKHAALEFEKWDHADGVVVAGLLRRRIAEEKVFLSGIE